MTREQTDRSTPSSRIRLSIAGGLVAVLLAGCVPTTKTRSPPQAQPIVAPPVASLPVAPPPVETSVKAIVNKQILRGHYDQGETSLRAYLVEHPGDPTAKELLRQLTVDPRKMLGRRSSPYVVQSGDSYSALAARYLGNANLFLVLARYNGSTNPSVLRAGEKLRMPSSASTVAQSAGPDAVQSTSSSESANDRTTSAEFPDGSATSSESIHNVAQAAPAAQTSVESSPEKALESLPEKAARLQRESVALMKRGKSEQALSRLDQALTVDVGLRPDGPASIALRKQLVASYHQRAIVLYRDQQLAPAISLWDRALAIDPQFEPALIYRARAKELQRRLKQL